MTHSYTAWFWPTALCAQCHYQHTIIHSGQLASVHCVTNCTMWYILYHVSIHYSFIAPVPHVAAWRLLYTPANWTLYLVLLIQLLLCTQAYWPLHQVLLTELSLYTPPNWPLYLVSMTDSLLAYTLQMTGLWTKCHRLTNCHTHQLNGLYI